MAWVRLYTLGNYQTELQQKLLGVLDDNSVHTEINQIIADMVKPYVPKDSGKFPSRNPADYPGRLRESASVTANGITWRTPYAHYVYRGELYEPNIPIHPKGDPKTILGFYSPKGETKHPTGKSLAYSTDGTGPHWFELMLMQERRRMNVRITNYLKAECKRRGL